MNEDKLQRKLRKRAKKLLRFACRHGIHYIDVSAFGSMGAANVYIRTSETSDAFMVSVYDREVWK